MIMFMFIFVFIFRVHYHVHSHFHFIVVSFSFVVFAVRVRVCFRFDFHWLVHFHVHVHFNFYLHFQSHCSFPTARVYSRIVHFQIGELFRNWTPKKTAGFSCANGWLGAKRFFRNCSGTVPEMFRGNSGTVHHRHPDVAFTIGAPMVNPTSGY